MNVHTVTAVADSLCQSALVPFLHDAKLPTSCMVAGQDKGRG